MTESMTHEEAQEAPPSALDRLLHPVCAGVAWVVLHPFRVPPAPTPAASRLPYRRVPLESEGARLAAWFIPYEGARAGIVLCHGHNNCRTQFRTMLRPLHEAGFHLLLFDFRSMGVSGGEICTYGCRERQDVLTAAEWLRREAGVEQVGLYGRSMGGASALLAAAHDPEIAVVVTDCAFARLEEMVERRFIYLPAPLRRPVGRSVRQWCERWSGVDVTSVDPEEALRSWRPRPLLVIHGERDLMVPPQHAHRLASAAGEGAELWMLPRAGHVRCEAASRRAYRERVAAFFRRHLAER